MKALTLKRSILLMFILAIVLILEGYIWLKKRPKTLGAALPEMFATNDPSPHLKTIQQKDSVPTHPLYGVASLSGEEKLFLYKPFHPDYTYHEVENAHKVRPIAMICMKHRLNRSEIMKLLSIPTWGPEYIGDGTTSIEYQFANQGILCFVFDQAGILKKVYGVNNLPEVESVTPDTPIELPPLPAEDANKPRVSQ